MNGFFAKKNRSCFFFCFNLRLECYKVRSIKKSNVLLWSIFQKKEREIYEKRKKKTAYRRDGSSHADLFLCGDSFCRRWRGGEYVPKMYATFWALVPPIVAIVLALITKEVYSSLFIGILVGALFYSNFSFEGTVVHMIQEGFISVISDSYNVGILIFLVILGAVVCLMNKAGGSAAFGRWAGRKIKSRIGTQLVTILLGVLIFIDDYFNCLTVGSVSVR